MLHAPTIVGGHRTGWVGRGKQVGVNVGKQDVGNVGAHDTGNVGGHRNGVSVGMIPAPKLFPPCCALQIGDIPVMQDVTVGIHFTVGIGKHCVTGIVGNPAPTLLPPC
ncbi:hypothetical protein D9M69_529210 [compost metagenome]